MTKEFFQDLLALAEKHRFNIVMPSERNGNDIVSSVYLDLKDKELVFDPDKCNGKMVDIYTHDNPDETPSTNNVKPAGDC